jgi:TorA maturation chaperone TorD
LHQTQAAFAKAEMRPWLGTLRDRVSRDDPDGYYAAAARLTEAALDAFYSPVGVS